MALKVKAIDFHPSQVDATCRTRIWHSSQSFLLATKKYWIKEEVHNQIQNSVGRKSSTMSAPSNLFLSHARRARSHHVCSHSDWSNIQDLNSTWKTHKFSHPLEVIDLCHLRRQKRSLRLKSDALVCMKKACVLWITREKSLKDDRNQKRTLKPLNVRSNLISSQNPQKQEDNRISHQWILSVDPHWWLLSKLIHHYRAPLLNYSTMRNFHPQLKFNSLWVFEQSNCYATHQLTTSQCSHQWNCRSHKTPSHHHQSSLKLRGEETTAYVKNLSYNWIKSTTTKSKAISRNVGRNKIDLRTKKIRPYHLPSTPRQGKQARLLKVYSRNCRKSKV